MTQTIKELCEKHGIQFAARSFGLTTTKTITLESIIAVVKDAMINFEGVTIEDVK